MHSIDYKRYTVHHNGDYSGDVIIHLGLDTMDDERGNSRVVLHHNPPYHEIRLPFDLLAEIVARKLRDDLVSNLENMEAQDILRIWVNGLAP